MGRTVWKHCVRQPTVKTAGRKTAAFGPDSLRDQVSDVYIFFMSILRREVLKMLVLKWCEIHYKHFM